mmetsp:Transcript_49346/g.138196  ORF Transcript_49346/g.138196 Transcript_49346/m.138196 type:complete len:469 (+) Transcript_49346:85-1491(+)
MMAVSHHLFFLAAHCLLYQVGGAARVTKIDGAGNSSNGVRHGRHVLHPPRPRRPFAPNKTTNDLAWMRNAYCSHKMGIERRALRRVAQAGHLDGGGHVRLQTLSGTPPPKVPKVAFLFMVSADVTWPRIWERFFEEAPRDRYSIYVHQAAPHGEKAPALERLGGVFVPQVPTEWCAVFGLEAELLSRALEDPLNVQFVFVSGTTVPLKTFDYVYRHLAEGSPASSKFCLATPASHRLAYHEYLPQAIQTCFYRDFLSAMSPRTLKHHQWAVLAREHARIVVQRSMEALDIFWESWSTTISDVEKPDGCTDESVPLTALLHDIEAKGGSTGKVDSDLALLGVEEQCLTFVRWQNCMRGTEFDSGVFTDVGKLFSNTTGLWDLLTRQGTDAIKQQLNNFPTTFSEIDVVYLSNLVAEGFMFARKFPAQVAVHSPKGAVEFSEILPRLWAGVNETYAKQSVWKRLDAARRQ